MYSIIETSRTHETIRVRWILHNLDHVNSRTQKIQPGPSLTNLAHYPFRFSNRWYKKLTKHNGSQYKTGSLSQKQTEMLDSVCQFPILLISIRRRLYMYRVNTDFVNYLPELTLHFGMQQSTHWRIWKTDY